jgi:hypothetical protein
MGSHVEVIKAVELDDADALEPFAAGRSFDEPSIRSPLAVDHSNVFN